MPRSHRPRKRYVPKHVDLDPANAAIARAALIPPHIRQQFTQPLQQAFQALRMGQGNWDAWRTVADALNVSERLAALAIARDHTDEIEAAQAALAALFDRHQATRSWTLRGPEIAALEQAVTIHKIQLDYATQGELYEAIDTVRRCVGQALAGNVSPSAKVCVVGALGAEHA